MLAALQVMKRIELLYLLYYDLELAMQQHFRVKHVHRSDDHDA